MKNSSCYYCGEKANTKEHVPPKQMFKGFDCDSITVPSCNEHNCSKGGQDQAIISALLLPFRNKMQIEPNDKNYFNGDIIKALKNAENSFIRSKNRVISKQIIDLDSEKLKSLPELGFIKAPISIKNWIRNLTAGIYYDATKFFDSSMDWNNIECWSPDYLKGKSDEKKSINEIAEILKNNQEYKSWLNSYEWIEGWSASPKKYPESIYCFFVSFDKDDIMIRHYFYKNYSWYAWFRPSSRALEKLILRSLKSSPNRKF